MPVIVEREPADQCRLAIDLPSGHGLNLCFENESELEKTLRGIVQAMDETESLENVLKMILKTQG